MRRVNGATALPAFLIAIALIVAPRVARGDAALDVQPHLERTVEGLVGQIRSNDTSYLLKRAAARRLGREFPAEAPDALVEFLYHPGAHFNEFVGDLLFELGRPNTQNARLFAEIRKGRKESTSEEIEAFCHAVAWPGNRQAIPVLQAIVDEKWDTTAEARICIAVVRDDGDAPSALLKLPVYQDGMMYPDRVIPILRKRRWTATNDLLIDWKSDHGLKDLDQLGLGAKNALGWEGNRAMADLFMNLDDATLTRFANGMDYTWSPWSARWEIPAVRTRDPRCLERARRRFERAVVASIRPDGTHVPGTTIPDPTAGIEAATEESSDAIGRLLKWTDRAKVQAEAEYAEWLKQPRDRRFDGHFDLDPGRFVRDTLLAGLCINPLPSTSKLVEVYARDDADDEAAVYAGFAMLRAGDPRGIRVLLHHVSGENVADGWQAEVLMTYSGTAPLPGLTAHAALAPTREWYVREGTTERFKERVDLINASGLLDHIIEDMQRWP